MTPQQREQCDRLLEGPEPVDLRQYVPPVKIVTHIKDIESLKDLTDIHHNLHFITTIPRQVIQRIVPLSVYQQKLEHYPEDETLTSVLNQAWDNTKRDALKKNMYSTCRKPFSNKIMHK